MKMVKSGFPGGCTVLMPVYAGDDAALFARALASVYANTLQPDQVLVIADGPLSEQVNEVLERYAKHPNFRLHRIPHNVGLHAALNIGLGQIHTAWVLRADADDYNVPGRFQLQADALGRNPAIDLIGGAIHEFERDGRFVAARRLPTSAADIRCFIRRRNPFNHMTVAFRVDAVRAVGGYPGIPLKEDYALWASMIGAGALGVNLDEVLVHATAGRAMYARRGGWRYAVSEVRLQRHLYRAGLIRQWEAWTSGLMRSVVFLLPSGLRGYLYEKLLRRAA